MVATVAVGPANVSEGTVSVPLQIHEPPCFSEGEALAVSEPFELRRVTMVRGAEGIVSDESAISACFSEAGKTSTPCTVASWLCSSDESGALASQASRTTNNDQCMSEGRSSINRTELSGIVTRSAISACNDGDGSINGMSSSNDTGPLTVQTSVAARSDQCMYQGTVNNDQCLYDGTSAQGRALAVATSRDDPQHTNDTRPAHELAAGRKELTPD